MPIYEFQCKNCGHEFDELARMGSEKTVCPRCLCNADKQLSLSNFHLKGNSWSKDGYTKKKED